MSELRYVFVLALVLAAACSGGENEPSGAGGAGGGENDLACADDPTFVEPDEPCVVQELEDWTGRKPDLYLTYSFPADGNCGEEHRIFWLKEGDDATVSVLVGVGDWDLDPGEKAIVKVRFFLDGVVTEGVWDGERAALFEFELGALEHRIFELDLSGISIPRGAHSAAILLYAERQGTPDRRRSPHLSVPFIINACGTDFSPVDLAPFRNPARDEFSFLADAESGEGLGLRIEGRAGTSRRLRLYFRSGVQDGYGPMNVALLALLGDEQIEFGDDGFAPTFVLDSSALPVYEFDLEFPPAGQTKMLRLLRWTAFKQGLEGLPRLGAPSLRMMLVEYQVAGLPE